MEIKKEEIEDYIKNNLYFLCNQEEYREKHEAEETGVIENLEKEKCKLLNQNSIVVEYKMTRIQNIYKCEIIKICFRKNEINMKIENVKEALDNIYDNCNEKEKEVLNENTHRYLIFKYLEEKVDKNKTQNLIEKIKNEVEEYIKNKKIKIKKINKYKQKIYYGVPGCGKSYRIKKEIEEVMESEKDKNNRVFRVTVHPDYSYSDFVGSIMPKVRDGKINYEFVPGIFTLTLKKALELRDQDKNVYLIIEEMTRGNIAEIFGDIFQLLDRNENGESEYEIDNENVYRIIYGKERNTDLDNFKIKLPSNFYLWGTLNTNDQNVFVMDNAFKRRFEFQLIKADGSKAEMNSKLEEEFKKFFENENKNGFEKDKFWRLNNNFVKKLNNYIVKELDLNEDKQIGNYFIKVSDDNQDFANIVANKLLYYLWYDVQKVTYGDKYIFNKDKITKFEDIFDKEDLDDIFDKNFCEKVIGKGNGNG